MKNKLLFLSFLGATFFANAQNVGIGTINPTRPLSFPALTGKKISLYPGASGDVGFGVFGNELRIHSDYASADITFGYDDYSSGFTERMRIINAGGNGMELNGRVTLKNGTSPLDLNYGPGIWLMKSDNSSLLGFMGTQNNQNIGFYGGPGGWGLTYDAINSRVGIGIASPAYPLHVTGNSSRTGNFVNTATSVDNYGLIGSCENTPGYGYGLTGSGGLAGVYGIAVLPGTGDRYGIAGDASNGTGYNYAVYGNANGGTVAYGIFAGASGAVTNWAGYFVGATFCTSGAWTGSDRKLKNDIKPLSGALSIINQLKPSVYTFKTNEYKQMNLPEGLQYGLIADEVQQVVPGAVKKAVQPAAYENHDEKKGKKLSDEVEFNAVNYTEMIPILIGAVKEQQIIINSQQKQIDELKKIVEKLLKQ